MTRVGGWPSSGFAAILERLRAEKKLSQSELAQRAGCHKQTISNLERGTQEPVWPLVLALAKALGVTPNDFMPEEVAPKKRGNK